LAKQIKTYNSKNDELRIVVDPAEREFIGGKKVTVKPSVVIQFHDGVFNTDNKKLIAFMEKYKAKNPKTIVSYEKLSEEVVELSKTLKSNSKTITPAVAAEIKAILKKAEKGKGSQGSVSGS